MNLTFLIPFKIESEDRVRNLITILTYLLSKFDATVLIKECDYQPKFAQIIEPALVTRFGKVPDKLQYFYEEQTQPFFHKTKILNDLLEESKTKVVCNYDVDALLPESSIFKSYEMIEKEISDFVYPYGCGVYQISVKYNQEIFENFIQSDMNLDYLNQHSFLNNSTVGWCQFASRKKYIESFMMNENFYAWGPEDCEFYYRLNFLGNKVDRINDCIYHLEHTRSNDSWFSNPMWQQNTNLWNWIRQQSKESLLKYFNNQDYVKRRNINVSL